MFDKYSRKDTIQSSYCYEGSEVYINEFDIRDSSILEKIESDLTSNRLAELNISPVSGRFGRTHLVNVHKYIFQDVYPFAGKIRTEDIWKGTTFFCKCEYIEVQLDEIFKKLIGENLLKNCSDDEFIKRVAYYMSELNIIHPFREGNGRVIREFVRILALQSNRIINWHYVNRKMLISAAIKAVDFEYDLLEQCISDSLKK